MMKLAYRKGYYLKHPKKFFSEIVVNLRWNWQRKKRGYSDADLWSLDVFMLGKMIEWLKAFRSQMLHSYPADIEGGYDGWLKTLDEMIENLECGKYVINPDEHPDYNPNSYLVFVKANEEEFKKGMDLLRDNYFSLWD